MIITLMIGWGDTRVGEDTIVCLVWGACIYYGGTTDMVGNTTLDCMSHSYW